LSLRQQDVRAVEYAEVRLLPLPEQDPGRDLEGVFHEQLKRFVFSPDEIAKHLAEADHTIKDKQELLETLNREQENVRREMDRVYQAYVKDEISMQAFGRQYRPLEDRLNQLEDEVPRLQGEVDFLKIQYLSNDQILAEARDLYSRWPTLTFEEKRHILEHIAEKITIGKDDVTIDLCYLPSPSSSPELAERQRNFRIHRRRQHEARRIAEAHRRARDGHHAVLHRLAQHLEHVLAKLGQLVEEQDAPCARLTSPGRG